MTLKLNFKFYACILHEQKETYINMEKQKKNERVFFDMNKLENNFFSDAIAKIRLVFYQ